jgi:hypothetical protein
MALKTRIDSVATDVKLMLDAALSPQAQSQAFAAYAEAAIADADATNRRVLGRVPPRTVTVDGARGAALSSVRPNGSIVAEWELIGEVLIWIGLTLKARSPFVSGDYQRAHTLYADGVEVAIGGNVPPADEYVFLNPLPYARKIEIGKTKAGRDFVIQVPNRIYERTAKDAAARFGNLAVIKMGYRAPFNSAILAGSGSRGKSAATRFERDLRVPAIVITLRAA